MGLRKIIIVYLPSLKFICQALYGLVIAWSTSAFLTPAYAQTLPQLNITTEDYAPYNYKENGEIKGVGYDQVVEFMKGVQATYTIEMMPWARAYALAANDAMTCVFSTAHIPERDNLFQWVEPLTVDVNVMITMENSPIHVKSIEESRAYTVGTERDDYTALLLQRLEFPHVDVAANLDLTVKKLESGRVDMMPVSRKFLRKLVKEGHALRELFTLSEQKFALACNKSVPKSLINAMQANLNRMIADGRHAAILKKYDMMQ